VLVMPPSTSPPAAGFARLAGKFLKRLGLILGASLGVVMVAALALGQFHAFGLSNLTFWSALIVLGIAVLPALSEMGSGLSRLGRAARGPDQKLEAAIAERQAQREKWLNSSVLFGTAGIALFVLSFLFAALFPGF
jgi:hypothetical protein